MVGDCVQVVFFRNVEYREYSNKCADRREIDEERKEVERNEFNLYLGVITNSP